MWTARTALPCFPGLLWTLMAVTVCGCFSRDSSAPPAPGSQSAPAATQAREQGASAGEGSTGAGDGLGAGRKPSDAIERKLIRDAELYLEVQSYGDARKSVDEKLAAAKGYLASARIDHAEGNVSSAELELRVPADRLDGFLAECGRLGTVLQESIKSQDITEEYYDLRARLDNARKLETRLLE